MALEWIQRETAEDTGPEAMLAHRTKSCSWQRRQRPSHQHPTHRVRVAISTKVGHRVRQPSLPTTRNNTQGLNPKVTGCQLIAVVAVATAWPLSPTILLRISILHLGVSQDMGLKLMELYQRSTALSPLTWGPAKAHHYPRDHMDLKGFPNMAGHHRTQTLNQKLRMANHPFLHYQDLAHPRRAL